jgi:hypothetical protein
VPADTSTAIPSILAAQYISPTLSGLEHHWQELQDAKQAYLDTPP